METLDIVNVLLQKAFHSFSYSAKLATKERGRPLPKIKVTRSNGNVSVVSATWFAYGTHDLLVALQAIVTENKHS